MWSAIGNVNKTLVKVRKRLWFQATKKQYNDLSLNESIKCPNLIIIIESRSCFSYYKYIFYIHRAVGQQKKYIADEHFSGYIHMNILQPCRYAL